MKILHLINYFNDNLDYQENRLIKLQKKNGHDVSLITSDRYYPFNDFELNYSKILGKRIVGNKTYNYHGVKIIRKNIFFELKKNAQCFFFNISDVFKFNPDIIHIHNCGTYTFISTYIYSIIFKKKIFVDCHQDFNNTGKNFLNVVHNFIWRIFYFFLKTKISLFLPINEYSKKFLISEYGLPREKIKIIPLGYDTYNKFSIKNYKNLIIKKFRNKLDKKELLIINSGKQSENKKIEKLIDLVKILNQRKFFCKLILIGNSNKSYNELIQKKIRSTNFVIGQGKIERLEFQSKYNLRKFLELANMAIWPGIPSITIQEALYANNIVMLPPESASNSLLVSKKLNFYNDLNRVAKNIIKIFNNKIFKSKIKHQNKLILDSLRWENINKNLEHIYEIR